MKMTVPPLHLAAHAVWLILLAATGVTFWLGESGWAGRAGMAPVLLMFALAFIKALLVMLEFMRLRHAPALWRRVMLAWLVLVVAGILLAYRVGL